MLVDHHERSGAGGDLGQAGEAHIITDTGPRIRWPQTSDSGAIDQSEASTEVT